jgi:hypothetical protein
MGEGRPGAAEAEQDSTPNEALLALLQGHLQHLRSIKDMELKWLDRFSAITLPLIGALLVTPAEIEVFTTWALIILVIIYTGLALWIQDVLRKERRSYYRVMRTVIRAQNVLGLLKRFLPGVMANAAFPKGMGPIPEEDGTKPFSSFLRRQILVGVLFLGVLLGVVWRSPPFWPIIPGGLVLDALWLVYIFRKDNRDLRNEALRDRDLEGMEPAWFPETVEGA